jgi:uncharacterized protein YjbI with pentapeptide repeats
MQSNLQAAEFRGADLRRATFRTSDLQRVSLSYTYLRGARFAGNKLHNVNFLRADLRGAHFSSIQPNDFAGATLEGAKLYGANLEGATNVSEEQLGNAYGDDKTKLPEGYQQPASWTNWVWVCPVCTDCFPLSHGASFHCNLLVL